VLEAQGRLEEAEEEFQEALGISQTNEIALAGLERLLRAQGRLAEADDLTTRGGKDSKLGEQTAL
jgi:tetratricopeptide (TPR) repeat protein